MKKPTFRELIALFATHNINYYCFGVTADKRYDYYKTDSSYKDVQGLIDACRGIYYISSGLTQAEYAPEQRSMVIMIPKAKTIREIRYNNK